jgi:hypothetical protein
VETAACQLKFFIRMIIPEVSKQITQLIFVFDAHFNIDAHSNQRSYKAANILTPVPRTCRIQ